MSRPPIGPVRAAVPARVRPRVRGLIEAAAGATRASFGLWGSRGAPLAVVTFARRAFPIANAFDAAPDVAATDASGLRNRELAALLDGAALGRWALAVDAVDVLEAHIRAARPATAIEFGSGVSTVCLAYLLREAHGDDRVRLVSIEQDERFAESTRGLLETAGLAHLVRLETRPLVPVLVDGATTTTYDLPPELVRELTQDAPPSLVLVDGPSGGVGRYATLRLVQPYLAPDATVVLDDALRDVELEIARRWHDAGATSRERVLPLGKGLLVARARSG